MKNQLQEGNLNLFVASQTFCCSFCMKVKHRKVSYGCGVNSSRNYVAISLYQVCVERAAIEIELTGSNYGET
jgi:hypothetical protein